MDDVGNSDFIRSLLDNAEPFPLEPERQTSSRSGDRTPGAESVSAAINAGSLARLQNALNFLVLAERIDLGSYGDWFNLACALKPYGEAGFTLFDRLSSEAGGYEGEEACRHKWDELDRPYDGKPFTAATYFKLALEAGWQDPETSSGGSSGGGKPDAAIVVLDQAEAEGDEHWLAQDGQAYVSFRKAVPDGEFHLVHALIASGAYRGVLQSRYLAEKATKVLPKQQEDAAIGILTYRAYEKGTRHSVFLRSAMVGDVCYVELGRADGKVVKIDAAGYSVVGDAPVRFTRGSRGELPLPEQGGTLELFARHFNLSRPDLIRNIGFCIGSFRSAGPFAILLIEGGSGSGKSSLGDRNIALTDPPVEQANARFSLSSDERNLHVHASHAKVLFFDNLSTIGARDADTLCRISTGASSSYRTHHTMTEETQFSLVRPVIATCIATPSDRNDLLSRCLRVTALPITEYRTEEELSRAFEADRPKMLGFLFEAISLALRNRPEVEKARADGLIKPPRLADFALFVEGASEILGLRPGEFCALLSDEQGSMQAEAVLGDPVAEALITYFSRDDATGIDKSARELLDLLKVGNRYAEFPAVNKLRGHLDRIKPGLLANGIAIDMYQDRHAKAWRMRISRTSAFTPIAVPTQPELSRDPF